MNQGVWYCANIVVATFWCLNITFLSATGAPISSKGLYENKNTFPDKSFGEYLDINNRTVTCSGKVQGSFYPTPMYTCNNIRVNGERLYHGYAAEGSRNREECNSGCPCGNTDGQPNDIQTLCSVMLQAHGVNESLIAAYVVKPFCMQGEKKERRVKLVLDDDKQLLWQDVDATNGYINILQCLTEKDHKVT